jgi:hypothetical protein
VLRFTLRVLGLNEWIFTVPVPERFVEGAGGDGQVRFWVREEGDQKDAA